MIAGGCKNKNSKTAEQTLREFYTQYITGCCELTESTEAATVIAKAKETFLTHELRMRLAEVTLDHDPFLNAQDCDKQWIETLEINPVSGLGMDNAYRVCYHYDVDHTNCITLFLIQCNGKWQINAIKGLFEFELTTEDEKKKPTEAGDEEGRLREIGLEEKIGNQTLIDYLADPKIPQLFKDIFLQELSLNDNEETLALTDSLSSTDTERHPFYFVLVTRALWWSDGAFSEPLSIAVRKYVETNTQQFLNYFLTEQVLTESDFAQWSRFTLYEMRMEWETMENEGKYIENQRKRMKENCIGCSDEKLKLIDTFVNLMYDIE